MKWVLLGSGAGLTLKLLIILALLLALRRGWLGRFDGRVRGAARKLPIVRGHVDPASGC
jgi:hypothetical protein